ncbi:MAG: ankyrin repeat domain-containing protein [Elusimicrobiota bacterium]|jgi:hypothetical protein
MRLRANLALLLCLGAAGCAGISPLHKAAMEGDTARVEELIQRGANVNARDAANQTPFMYAGYSGNVATLKVLLKHGASVSHLALSYAAAKGSLEAVKFLHSLGANPEAKNFAGLTALQVAEREQHADVAAYLRALRGPTPAPSAPSPAAAFVEPAQPQPEQLSSDIDKPAYRMSPRLNDYALIIGVGRYSALPEAQFAERDAEAVKQHLLALGLPARNIIHLSGSKATRGGIQGYVEEWLPKNAKADGTVFFYYSGHGAPDTKTGQAYLVPWDGDAAFLQSTAYPLKQLYASLGALTSKSVIVALDSCFSGAGGRSVLAQGARPLVMQTEESVETHDKLTVFSAASSDEITGTLAEQGHGVFTYYFLKGLGGAAKNPSGAVTAKGLFEYVRPNVQDEAHRQNREQTPRLLGEAREQVLASHSASQERP